MSMDRFHGPWEQRAGCGQSYFFFEVTKDREHNRKDAPYHNAFIALL